MPLSREEASFNKSQGFAGELGFQPPPFHPMQGVLPFYLTGLLSINSIRVHVHLVKK